MISNMSSGGGSDSGKDLVIFNNDPMFFYFVDSTDLAESSVSMSLIESDLGKASNIYRLYGTADNVVSCTYADGVITTSGGSTFDIEEDIMRLQCSVILKDGTFFTHNEH